jgi:hypothetical protein
VQGRLSSSSLVVTPENVKTPLWKKISKTISKLLAKTICIFDDIPFLLQIKDTGNVGSFLLVGAGFLIFPVQAYEGFKGIRKACRPDIQPVERRAMLAANISKLGLAVLGFAASAALLAFILTHLVFLAAAASITIPGVMAVIGGVELVHEIHGLIQAKKEKNSAAIQESKRGVAYSTAFFGFGLAITGLATLSVLTGLGVLTMGVVPAAILVGVVVAAFALKVFQIIDSKKDVHGERHYPLTSAISNFWHKVTNLLQPQHNVSIKLAAGMRDMYQTLGTDSRDNAGVAVLTSTPQPVLEEPLLFCGSNFKQVYAPRITL